MREDVCSNCGAHDWIEKDGYRICTYCGSRFPICKDTGTAPDADTRTTCQEGNHPSSSCRKRSRRSLSPMKIARIISIIGIIIGLAMIAYGLTVMPDYWFLDVLNGISP